MWACFDGCQGLATGERDETPYEIPVDFGVWYQKGVRLLRVRSIQVEHVFP